MQSVEMYAVTNARVSGDYQPGNDDWDIGTSSILAHALGIAPSKDNYWTTEVQTGYPKKYNEHPNYTEPHSRLHSAEFEATPSRSCRAKRETLSTL